MVKDIKTRISSDLRGSISTGKQREGGGPQSLDYFDVSDFRELIEMYGLEPKRLLIFCPSDTVADFYDCNYVKWYTSQTGTRGKTRQCDGEECLHRVPEEADGKKYEAGEVGECICAKMADDDKRRCKYEAYMKVYVANPTTGRVENPTCYIFQTHSKNSGDAIYSEFEKIKSLNMGVLRGVPFILSVKMVPGKDNPKIKFPIWSIQAGGTMTQITAARGTFLEKPMDAPVEVPALVAPVQPSETANEAPGAAIPPKQAPAPQQAPQKLATASPASKAGEIVIIKSVNSKPVKSSTLYTVEVVNDDTGEALNVSTFSDSIGLVAKQLIGQKALILRVQNKGFWNLMEIKALAS